MCVCKLLLQTSLGRVCELLVYVHRQGNLITHNMYTLTKWRPKQTHACYTLILTAISKGLWPKQLALHDTKAKHSLNQAASPCKPRTACAASSCSAPCHAPVESAKRQLRVLSTCGRSPLSSGAGFQPVSVASWLW